jgi:predicted AAA+ superfamily ATPase
MPRKLTLKELGKLSVEEKKRIVYRLHVTFPRLKRIAKEIESCRQQVKLGGEAEGLLITGDRGAGKTTFCQRYEREFPRQVTEEGTIVPVLSATVPVPATPKSLATELLDVLGDPAADKGTLVSRTNRLKRALKMRMVELIILDEFQHFQDRESQKVLKTISDWLKVLIDKTSIPIVLVGMPYSGTILDAKGNEQLQRRFAMRLTLEPFGYEDPVQQKDFQRFLKEIDDALPLIKSSDLASPAMAFRIYTATDGVIAYVMKLIRHATVMALDLAKTELTLDLLEIAYEQRLAGNHPERENPFLRDLCDLKLPRAKRSPPPPPQEATNNRSKASPRTLRASDVL